MKRGVLCFALCVFLWGCESADSQLQRPMVLRQQMLMANACTFDATITADYGDAIHIFGVNCATNGEGDLIFEVTDPETVAGISGHIKGNDAALTFDDHVLAFPTLADGQVTPVTAPWLLVKTLRSGYISGCGQDGELLRVSIDDSYEENPISLDIWLDQNDKPIRGEIFYKGKRILTLEVKDFTIV